MALPLPASYHDILAAAQSNVNQSVPNASLLFDRGLDAWPDDFGGPPDPDGRRSFLEHVAGYPNRPPTPTYLSDLRRRRDRRVRALGGRIIGARTTWRLVVGLGSNPVLESGFSLDRNLGLPFIPGTMVKGLLRAWVTQWLSEDELASTDYLRLFGDTADRGAGMIVVHDVFPRTCDVLEVDLLSTHFPRYYRSGGTLEPADDDVLNIVPFLAVKAGTEFEFALTPRGSTTAQEDLEHASRLLGEALYTLGIGAKTAVGYGHFRPPNY